MAGATATGSGVTWRCQTHLGAETRSSVAAPGLDPPHEPSSSVCFTPPAFAAGVYWMRALVLRRNFECKHLILGTSAVVGSCTRREHGLAHLSLQNPAVIPVPMQSRDFGTELSSGSTSLGKSCCGKQRVSLPCIWRELTKNADT